MHQQRVVSLWEMLELRAKPFVTAMELLGQMTGGLRNLGPANPDNEPSSSAKDLIRPAIADLYEAIDALNLGCARVSLDRLLGHLNEDHVIIKKTNDAVLELRGRILDQLKDEFFIIAAAGDIELYVQNNDPFGNDVRVKFPTAVEDISEAARCLALGRYTATIFHLMRAMEVALQAIADKLGATYIDKNGANLTWLMIATNTKTKIDAMSNGAEKADWCRVHAHFDSVGRAWRNPTMHPKQTYTEVEAREVYAATKGFMVSLAPMLP